MLRIAANERTENINIHPFLSLPYPSKSEGFILARARSCKVNIPRRGYLRIIYIFVFLLSYFSFYFATNSPLSGCLIYLKHEII
jgi:hypothetical protein